MVTSNPAKATVSTILFQVRDRPNPYLKSLMSIASPNLVIEHRVLHPYVYPPQNTEQGKGVIDYEPYKIFFFIEMFTAYW